MCVGICMMYFSQPRPAAHAKAEAATGWRAAVAVVAAFQGASGAEQGVSRVQ